MSRIDLNADMGEGMPGDAELIAIVSSANIACGGHAGDERTMRETVRLAKANHVSVGAHPGFADKDNFGRVRLDLTNNELSTLVTGQVGALRAIAAEEGVPVAYVKLHGALANMAAEDVNVALAAFAPLTEIDASLKVLALDHSAQVDAALRLGLGVIREAYADRAYTRDGLLVSRQERGAVLHDAEDVVAQCLRLAEHGEIVAMDGTVIVSSARSICVHGDTPGAVEMARKIAAAFAGRGIEIAASE